MDELRTSRHRQPLISSVKSSTLPAEWHQMTTERHTVYLRQRDKTTLQTDAK